MHHVELLLPASSSLVVDFVSYLYMKSYSSSSIASHLSAISFVHKFYEYADPCCSFIVQRALLVELIWYSYEKLRHETEQPW